MPGMYFSFFPAGNKKRLANVLLVLAGVLVVTTCIIFLKLLNLDLQRRHVCFTAPLLYLQRTPLIDPAINTSCQRLFDGDKNETQRIRQYLKSWIPPNDIETIESIKECQCIRRDFMNKFYISETERNFPLAFQMLIYYQKNLLLQHIRLLKYLYRPHNIYCIHIDKKSPKWWTDGLRQFTKCFNNIFISTKQVHIVYGSVSILDAHLSCLKDLVNVTADWRYVITLNSPEIPLVTNKEMVDTLIKMNGTNVMTVFKDVFTEKGNAYEWLWQIDKQYKKKYIIKLGLGIWIMNWIWDKKISWKETQSGNHSIMSQLGPIPYNLTVYKSAESVNSAMSRDFVKFIVTDKRALALRKRLEYVHAAEEFFFATLYKLKDAPGNHYTLKKHVTKPIVSRPFWNIHPKKTECIEKYFIHNICILSVSDLPYLKNIANTWFLNKYRIDYDHVVMDCMEELLLKKHFREHV